MTINTISKEAKIPWNLWSSAKGFLMEDKCYDLIAKFNNFAVKF